MKIEVTIGLDVSKETARYHCLDASGKTLRKGSIGRCSKEAGALVACLPAKPESVLVVAEATGMLHIGFCHSFAAEGCEVVAINPLYSKARSQRNAIRGAKSDPIDAEQLAELGLREPDELLRRFAMASDQRVRLQRFVSARKQLRSCLTNLLKHTGELANAMFPEFSELGFKLTASKTRAMLSRYPTTAEISRTSEAELAKYAGSKARALKLAAGRSEGVKAVSSACSKGLLACLIRELDSLYRCLDELDGKISALVRPCVGARQLELAMSLVGFGEKTASKVLAFLPPQILSGGSKRKVARKIQALFGAEPRTRSSGKWKGKERISKRGVEIARTALFQASFCSLKFDAQLKSYYDKQKAAGKSHRQAVVDVMRKQIERLVCVLKEDRPFRPDKQSNPQ
ncbi:IS110 family transposase [Pelagicoccus mobilis]|uniref:IS110 family transposase n=1 Tax=Pelagicoccus mobilis TaxID=415221 RepID=A0A934S6Z9_9BACT|nr:IS110 family transposase [Pelagicoccus mobilis]MBK1880083.1 IS110 family transposase [Pelagicoccus mobilis]